MINKGNTYKTARQKTKEALDVTKRALSDGAAGRRGKVRY